MFASTNVLPVNPGRSVRDRLRSYFAAVQRHSVEKQGITQLHELDDRHAPRHRRVPRRSASHEAASASAFLLVVPARQGTPDALPDRACEARSIRFDQSATPNLESPMQTIRNIVIGAGQAGLAMSHCLTAQAEPHVVLERGVVGNSWANERWDSLRLLTPNWQSRLPGYTSIPVPTLMGTCPSQTSFEFLERYAVASAAPVETGVTVTSVTRDAGSYIVTTDKGIWRAANVVLASGACNRASHPALCKGPSGPHRAGVAADLSQPVRPARRRGPRRRSLCNRRAACRRDPRTSGRPVILAAGNHIRMPRHYRGHDIQWWMEHAGLLSATADTRR